MPKGDGRGKARTSNPPKPGGSRDGRLAENGGGKGGAKRGPKPSKKKA